MYIVKVGFHHQTTPIEVREQFAFDEQRLGEANTTLQTYENMLENVILSTCNRTEIYAVVDDVDAGIASIKTFLQDWFSIPKIQFQQYIVTKENDAAIEHLFYVSTGLNSMVLGETQILGQVRDAFLLAQKEATTGTMLNELFLRAITFAKRSHKETAIGEHAVSISYAAVQLAKKIHGSMADKDVVVYGAGEMGELAIKHLLASGAKKLTIVNRTFENARQLADRYHIKALAATELNQALIQADILISSTASNSPVINKKDLYEVEQARRGKPLFLLDIAVPRDIASDVHALESVFLYDIDDLQHIVDENKAERERAAEKIMNGINVEIEDFIQWVLTLEVVPILQALREKSFHIQAETYNSILRKIPSLDERERKVILKHTKSIVNQILREPIHQAKEISGKKRSEEKLSLFVDIFGLDESIKKEIKETSQKTKKIVRRHPSFRQTIFDK